MKVVVWLSGAAVLRGEVLRATYVEGRQIKLYDAGRVIDAFFEAEVPAKLQIYVAEAHMTPDGVDRICAKAEVVVTIKASVTNVAEDAECVAFKKFDKPDVLALDLSTAAGIMQVLAEPIISISVGRIVEMARGMRR